jgi:hypothetical protein
VAVLAGMYTISLARARQYLNRTPFGLEREVAQRRQNSALAMLTLLVLLVLAIFLAGQLNLQHLLAPIVTPLATLQPTPTASPVAASANLVVDSSGCDNAQATLSAPKSGERIAGAYEVRGSADIENFAFYKFEISGAGTGGEWLSLGVGTERRVNGVLGRFDSSSREPGEYAFRLVVLDNAGNFPVPCVVPVTLLPLQ